MNDLADQLYLQVLVVRCQVGDRLAFAELVALFQPRLCGYLSKMLASQHVDDVAQEVWLEVYRGLGKLADPAAFAAWMFRIAHHRAFALLRRWRLPVAASIDEVDVADDPGDEPSFGDDEAAAVHAALDRLTPEYREALLLRFIEDLSYDAIAAVMGCPVGTVRSRIHNGKRLLRQMLERTGER
jgi:RNA polymerase sigma-70 factor (ECF subfamily)